MPWLTFIPWLLVVHSIAAAAVKKVASHGWSDLPSTLNVS